MDKLCIVEPLLTFSHTQLHVEGSCLKLYFGVLIILFYALHLEYLYQQIAEALVEAKERSIKHVSSCAYIVNVTCGVHSYGLCCYCMWENLQIINHVIHLCIIHSPSPVIKTTIAVLLVLMV